MFRPPEPKLGQIHFAIDDLVNHHEPDYIAVETQFFNFRTPTALKTAQARGAALAAVWDIPVIDLAPTQVKNRTTGHGNASKEQVRGAVCRLLVNGPDKFKSLDESDAIAIALSA